MDTNAMQATSEKSGTKSLAAGAHQPRFDAGSCRFVSLTATTTPA
ncbi:MAG TPA: hypothetical protein VK815_01490 [Candidatus Acidoferrales bacterium]|nr:hypothetical protein [Candidatus Acidoferrales bacterium]